MAKSRMVGIDRYAVGRDASEQSAAAARRPFTRLPRGPHGGHGPTIEQVAADQRSRLQRAMIETGSERGYAAVTGRELCARAGVSKATLYAHFKTGVSGCLVGACEWILEELVVRVRAAQSDGADWHRRLALAIDAILTATIEAPCEARLVLLDAFDVPETIPALLAGAERLEEALADCFCDLPVGSDPPALVVRGVIAGVAHVIRAHLLAAEAQLPVEHALDLAAWACACCSPNAGEKAAHFDTHRAAPPTTRLTPARIAASAKPAADERVLLAVACIEVVAERGSAGLSASRITAMAHMRRSAFREHFEDVNDCFIAAYSFAIRAALAHALRAGETCRQHEPVTRAQRAVTALAQLLAADRALARLAFCEILTQGAVGVATQTRLLDAFASELGRICQARDLPPTAMRAGAGATWALAGHIAAAGRAPRLPANVALLARVALPKPISGTAHTTLTAQRRREERD